MNLYQITKELLDCACIALAEQTPPWEGQCCVEPSNPVLKPCCESGGQAWARVIRTYPTTSFPRADESTDQSRCGTVQWASQIEIGVARCICADICDCDAKGENAESVYGDAEAVLRGVLCCIRDKTCDDVEYRITGQEMFGPQGGCGGSKLTVVVARELCC